MTHRTTTAALVALLAVASAAPGCAFKRARINEKLLETADTTPLVVGETTFEEALDLLGPPAVTNELELFDHFLLHPRHLRYTVADRRTSTILFLPTWITGVNEEEDKQADKELLLLFDPQGVLTHAWLGGRRSVNAMATDRKDRVRDETRPVGGAR